MASSPDLCQIPAGPAPGNLKSNLNDPQSMAPAMVTVMSFMLAWAMVFIAGRIYNNIRKLAWSDYFALIAFVLTTALFCLLATRLQSARHMWDVPACLFDTGYAKGNFFAPLLNSIAAPFAKASILMLFLQIFEVHRAMQAAIWIGLAFNFLTYFPSTILVMYYGIPRSGETWIDTLDTRTLTPLRWYQVQAGLAILEDVYIFILPLPATLRLNMSIRRRAQVVAVFSIALLGVGTSVAVLWGRVKMDGSNDITWLASIFQLCNFVELNVAIIVSSAPGFCGFTRKHFFPKLSQLYSGLSSGKAPDSEAASGAMHYKLSTSTTQKREEPREDYRKDSYHELVDF